MLKTITFTGIDESITDFAHFSSLEFVNDPLTEFGVLFGKDYKPRYPTLSWRKAFYAQCPNVRRSAHLCGNTVYRALIKQEPGLLYELRNYYERVQINIQYNDWNKTSRELLLTSIPSGWTVITQFNTHNQHLPKLCENHLELFDSSEGRGLTPSYWHSASSRQYVGYSGGLSPDNLEEQLPKIHRAAGGANYWIDMESGVRSDDGLRFDIDKCFDAYHAALDFIDEK